MPHQAYKPTPLPFGGLAPASIAKQNSYQSTIRSMQGAGIEAVVIRAYYVNDRNQANVLGDERAANLNPNPEVQLDLQRDMVMPFCDVLMYSRNHAQMRGMLQHVMVTYDNASIHEGDIWLPRATTMNLSQQALNGDLAGIDPASLDGDHVLIAFIDNDPFRPYIQRYMKHPSGDIGNIGRPLARRCNVENTEGQPRYVKRRGVYYGVDTNGNGIEDLTRAYDGTLDELGREPRFATEDPALGPNVFSTDGTNGNKTINIRGGSSFTVNILPDPMAPDANATQLKVEAGKVSVQIAGGPNLTLTQNGADSVVTIGDPSAPDSQKFHVPNYERLKAYVDTLHTELEVLRQAYNLHTQPVTGTTAGPPTTQVPSPFTAFPDTIKSSHILMPDE